MISFGIRLAAAVGCVAAIGFVATTFQHPPVTQIQRGYRGVGMNQIYSKATVAKLVEANKVPAPEDPQDPSGQPSSAAYQNVQVLKNVDSSEFLRLMAAMTTWVSPQQGCNYCHIETNLASDALYTKVVARRMLQMTQHINSGWKNHVAATGVTCYTCHRGQPVPANIWFADPRPAQGSGMAQEWIGKNHPALPIGSAALPSDVFTPYLDKAENIRVISTAALPGTDHQSLKQAEWTYGLMMHLSTSLGVNCTYCHNSRSFFDWDQSTPQRATAWYGIRMVRDLNTNYLDLLTDKFPHSRLGPMGDGPKVNCATCHAGVYKPLFGVSMLKDYPELGSPSDQAVATPAAAQAPTPASLPPTAKP